ncbi:LOW QUALITY PROTEIN: conserved hypothetical protein, partial [Streptomyces sp. SPB78]
MGGGVRGQAEGMGERREGDGTAGPSCVTYTSFGVPGIDPLLGDHRLLRSLLGAWALAACSPKEALAVETHLGVCGACADEALRLRDAVGLLHPQEPLDLDPSLRARVLARCLERRPPRVPVPAWAEPYDTETARLDALLQSLADADWHAPVRLRWWTPEGPTGRRTTVAGVIAHLLAVDGLVAAATGLPDPLGADAPGMPVPPEERTERYLAALGAPPTRAEHAPWREQTHALVRTAGLPDGEDGGSGGTPVPYGGFSLPLRDALLERAFETWIHAWDIATAVSYPYAAPAGPHLRLLIDLATRLVPQTLAAFPPPDAETPLRRARDAPPGDREARRRGLADRRRPEGRERGGPVRGRRRSPPRRRRVLRAGRRTSGPGGGRARPGRGPGDDPARPAGDGGAEQGV